MKTVAKINPEKEYETAKNLIDLASQQILDPEQAGNLDASVSNLITAARILMEREERRRGQAAPPAKNPSPKGRSSGEEREEAKKLPSLRYPDLEVRESITAPEHPPMCTCCQSEMQPSGLFEISEKLEVIPKKYYIQRNKRVKFNCGKCYGSMKTAPPAPSILPTSNYGDSMMVDAALSKYCDLIPMERYALMAEQSGLGGELPAQSLIGLTHHLANFLEPIYKKIKTEVLSSKVLLADETPHRMLEGDDTKNWYLWGFFSSTACYFETHNTRSGDVALNFLTDSKATILLTDAYAGYGKAIKEIAKLGRQILEAHCNAHAFRYFKEASITWESECEIFLKLYGQVYDLERERKEVNESLEFRARMLPYFEEIKLLCEQRCDSAMPGSQLHKAMNYFLNHYKGLTLCLEYLEIPLDNNESERELRSPVVGRKTWLGTHSKRGALTSAVLFSVVQSCKRNGVNPKNYFPSVVKLLHQRKEAMTPYEYSLTLESEQGTL